MARVAAAVRAAVAAAAVAVTATSCSSPPAEPSPPVAEAEVGCAAPQGAERVVTCLYDAYLAVRPSGLPDAEQERTLAPFLSRSLLALLAQARSYQRAYAERLPEEKPPWADGCLFASLFEGPDRYEIVATTRRDDGVTEVALRFGYQDAPPWQDVALVAIEDGRPKVFDVRFGGAGEFNPPGGLAATLAWREE